MFWSTILYYLLGDLLVKRNHYEINVNTVFSLASPVQNAQFRSIAFRASLGFRV